MAYVGACVPKMAKSGFRVTSSPEFATLLQIHNTGDEDNRRLATHSYHYS